MSTPNPVKYMSVKHKRHAELRTHPNAGPNPNIYGMRRIYGKKALLVKSGAYLYNVSASPHLYHFAH